MEITQAHPVFRRFGLRFAGVKFTLRSETLALLTSLLFTAFYNNGFWAAVSAGHDFGQVSSWIYLGCLFALLASLQFILLVLLINRWTAKPLLTLLILASASAAYFTTTYGIYFDTGMVRNILHTDMREAGELLTAKFFGHLVLYTALPLLLLTRIEIRRDPPGRYWLLRPLTCVLALLVAVGALLPVSQAFVPFMREHKAVRHLATPSNFVVSLARVLSQGAADTSAERIAIGTDAKRQPAAVAARKPRLLVVVIGETVRAANWGLNGYARQTTPELAGMDVLNFSRMESCGTSTAVSLPCMFSPGGHHDYNEERIRESESLLHVLTHAGVGVLWRDNQSGCKGVCEGLPAVTMADTSTSLLCSDGSCPDEILLEDFARLVHSDDQVIVMHMLGNHGPAYYRRYPAEFRRYTPTCDSSELARCTPQGIVNSYDNAILYTDHVLAQAITLLQAQAATHETALIYLSDHGESLGENGLYLHGLPRAIAPETQTRVPMVMWLSPEFRSDKKLDRGCLNGKSTASTSHDFLFHTVLGIFDIQSSVYDRHYDVLAGCHA